MVLGSESDERCKSRVHPAPMVDERFEVRSAHLSMHGTSRHGDECDGLGGGARFVVLGDTLAKQHVQLVEVELGVIHEHHEVRLEGTGGSTWEHV